MARWLFVPILFVVAGALGVFGTVRADDNQMTAATEKDNGFLGVYLGELTSDIAKDKGFEGKEGAYITGVVDDSPAEKAGIKRGDIITNAGGKSVKDSDQLEEIIESTGAGNQLPVTVFRDGKEITLSAVLDEEPDYGMGSQMSEYMMSGPFAKRNIRNFFISGSGTGKLGVKVQDMNPQLAKYFKVDEGVLVTEVMEDRPAAKAGMQAGDVITKVAGEKVEDAEDLTEEIGEHEVGDKVEIAAVRDGSKMTFNVELDDPMAKYHRYGGYMGVQLQDLNSQLKDYFKVDNGVLITEVVEDSPAEKAGLKAGDIVITFDGKSIKNSSKLREAVRDRTPGDKVDVVVVRDKKEQTIKVELGKSEEMSFQIFGDSGDPESKMIIIDEVIKDARDALDDVRIEDEPRIERRNLEIELEDMNEAIRLQTRDLRQQIENLRTIEIEKRLQDAARRLSAATQGTIEDLNRQIDTLRKELQRLEEEKIMLERM